MRRPHVHVATNAERPLRSDTSSDTYTIDSAGGVATSDGAGISGDGCILVIDGDIEIDGDPSLSILKRKQLDVDRSLIKTTGDAGEDRRSFSLDT